MVIGEEGIEFQGSLKLNSRVRLKNTGREGIVTGILPDRQYRIFISEHEQPIVSTDDIEVVTIHFKFVTTTEFLKDLLLFKLRRPLSDTLYSYAMSRTNFEAYQFKPAIKFLRSPNGRILIADEVGLGKTIEACIIYLELKARMQGDLPRVLVVCPAGLRGKWQSELMARFNEEFEIMDSSRLHDFFSKWENSGPSTRLRGICSLEGLRQEQFSTRIAESGVQFDLVVIDEAHHMRNPETLSFDLGEILSEHADALLLLTATPVHLRSLDLFYLLSILDPGQFETPELFEYQLEPNKHINKAIIDLCKITPDFNNARRCLEQCASLEENPFYKEATQLIDQIEHDRDRTRNRERLVLAIRDLHELNAFSLVFNRTRRREAMQGAIRQATVVNVSFTLLEAQIYQEALKFARARAQYVRGYTSVLGLIQIERQIASSLGAFKMLIDDFLSRKPYEAEVEESATEIDRDTSLPQSEVYTLCRKLQGLYVHLGGTDTKFEEFQAQLDKLLASDSSRKVIVYSFFRKTLSYLHKRLTETGHKVDVIHGGKDVRERQGIIDRFRQDEECRVLLSSEVGAEGLDLQFCDTIVNYDLPWNPMRVEQRIGRIDRYGQKSDKVTIISFFLRDTIEERILQRLYERIGVFEESIGGLEPILGEIVTNLSREVISSELTVEQERERTEQFLSMLENRRRELEDFERHRDELMSQDTAFAEQVRDNIASGRFVSAKEIRALIQTYIAKDCPRSELREVDRLADNWLLVPDNLLLDKLESFLNSRGSRAGREDWEFRKRVLHYVAPRGRFVTRGAPGIPLTFNSDIALQRPLLEFVTVWHSLVRLAFASFGQTALLHPEGRMGRFKAVDETRGKTGIYHFFLFCFSVRAIVDTDELVAVVVNAEGDIDPDLSERFLRILHDNLSDDDASQLQGPFDMKAFEASKSTALEFMSESKRNKELAARQRNDALIASRRAALEKTFEVKERRALSRLEKATDTRIIRMHQGEIRNLKNKLQNAVAELEAKRKVSVVYEPIAYGLMEMQPG